MRAGWTVRTLNLFAHALIVLIALATAAPAWLFASVAHADPSVPVPNGYRQDDYRAPVPDSVPGGVVLHVRDMQALLAQGGALLVDVLPAPRRPEAIRPGSPWLPQPHRTLPGAVWLPEVGRGALPADVEVRFAARLRALTGGDPGRVVVFFCLNDCWMSWNAARRAAALGVRAGWFPEGVDGWQAAGLPTETRLPEE